MCSRAVDAYRRRVPDRIRTAIVELVDMWIPSTCTGCGGDGRTPCRDCLDRFVPADPFPCPVGLDGVVALLRYDEISRPFVLAMKEGRTRPVARAFARPLAALVDEVLLRSPAPVLTWAPTSSRRRRARGEDQAETLARAVAHVAHAPARRLLRRKGTARQTGRDRRARAVGVSFEVVGQVPPSVIVCDDVLTTGSTLHAAATTLRRAGARRVHGLVFAHTPLS